MGPVVASAIEQRSLSALIPYAKTARTHPPTQVSQILATSSNRPRIDAKNAPIEPRAAIGHYDAVADRLELLLTGQGVHSLRQQLANAMFHMPPDRIVVHAPDVGGGFSVKNFLYPAMPKAVGVLDRRPASCKTWPPLASQSKAATSFSRSVIGCFEFPATHPLTLGRFSDFNKCARYLRLSPLVCCGHGAINIRDSLPSSDGQQARRKFFRNRCHYPAAPNLQHALIILAAAIAEAKAGAGAGSSLGSRV